MESEGRLMFRKKKLPAYTEKQRERIRLGHAIVNDFSSRQGTCACCGAALPCARMVKLTACLRAAFGRRPERLPYACFVGLPEVSAYYRSLQFSAFFQGKDLFGRTISAQEWLIRHSESAISRRQSEFVYATLYCPVEPCLTGAHPPQPGEDGESRKAERTGRRAYEQYLSDCEKYVEQKLLGRRKDSFFCFECAAVLRGRTAELTAEFQKKYPPEKLLPENCLTPRPASPKPKPKKPSAPPRRAALPQPEAGESWEGRLANELGFLPGEYICLRRFPGRLKLSSMEFHQGEEQEFSQLIVSPYGVFSISSENLNGKLTITPDGLWMHSHDGRSESILSPVLLAKRRAAMLESILPEEVPVYNIICIADRSAVIEGGENAEYPVIRCDLLCPLIEGIAKKAGAIYSSRQVNGLVLQLSRYIRK